MSELQREKKELHYKGESYYLKLKSEVLPFVIDKANYSSMEKANELVQKFVSLIEKKFDAVWYIGADFVGERLCERFIFQHGGFMEISMNGEIEIYLYENKTEEITKALYYAISKLSSKGSAVHAIRSIKVGKKLISLESSLKI